MAQEGHRLGGGGPQQHTPRPPGPQQTPAPGDQFHATGKRMEIDFAEANQALAHLQEAISRLTTAYDKAAALSQIQNPGREQPSIGFAGRANPIGEQKRSEILNQLQAVRAMRDNLQAQLRSHQRTDGENADNHRRIQE